MRRHFYEVCLEALGLRLPVELKFYPDSTISYDGVEGEAWHTLLEDSHLVEVCLGGNWGEYVLIGHELCHAYVRENYPNAEDHGYIFRRVCRYLEGALEAAGYILASPLYDPRTDT